MEYILTRDEALLRGSYLSQVSYKICLVLDQGDSFSGFVLIDFTLSSRGIWLDFKGKSVFSVELNNQPQTTVYSRNRIYLDSAQVGKNSVKVVFESFYSHDGMGLHSLIDPADSETYLYSQFEPFGANRVFPCFDQPDLKSFFQLSVVSKSDWKVISNTSLLSDPLNVSENSQVFDSSLLKDFSELDQSTWPLPSLSQLVGKSSLYTSFKIHHFKETEKISTYLVAICAGPYYQTTVDFRYPLGFYCRKSMKSSLNIDLIRKWTVAGFDFYEKYFDYPYPFHKYDQVFVPEFNFVAMENVGCVVLDDIFLNPEASYNKLMRFCVILLHEMSHMWFGNLVTMKWWDDLWLNESFATFISFLCVSQALSEDFPEIWSFFYTKVRHGLKLDQQSGTHPISCTVNSSVEIFSFFDAITYEKGSAVLKQLYYLIGEERFKASLQGYFKKNCFSNTQFLDFINEIKLNVEGIGLDIELWANEWIKTSGVNEIVPEVTRDSQGAILKIALSQRGVKRLHRFKVGFFNQNFDLVHETEIQGYEQAEIEGKGEFLFLDTGNNGYFKGVLDRESFEFFFSDLGRVKDRLTRLQIIGSVFDLTSDKKIQVGLFFDFAIKNLSSEGDLFNIIFLVRSVCEVFKALDYNGNRQVVEGTSQEIVKILNQKIGTADQLTNRCLYRLLVKVLNHPNDIREALRLLSLDLPSNIRWGILKKYSTLDLAAKDLVDQELANNKNHQSILSALYCSAAYPDEMTKLQVWNRLISDHSRLSKFERTELMKGFSQESQQSLLRPFGFKFFYQVLRIAEVADLDFSKDFIKNLMPYYLPPGLLKENLAFLKTEIPQVRNDLHIIVQDSLDRLDSLLS